MKVVIDDSRRQLLKKVALGAALLPLAGLGICAAFGADTPLVTEDDPTAKALKYVADASKATGAKPGASAPTAIFSKVPRARRKVHASYFRARLSRPPDGACRGLPSPPRRQ